MRYKLIDLDANKKAIYVGSGAFGDYYRLNSRLGVKIMKYPGLAESEKYTKDWARKCLAWSQNEAKNLQKAKNSKIVPMFKGYCIVKRGNEYHPGILMQHLEHYIDAEKFLDYSDLKNNKNIYRDQDSCPFKPHIKFAKKLKMEKVIDAGTLYKHVNALLKKRSKIKHEDLHASNIMFKLSGNQVVSIRVVDLQNITEVS